MFSNLFQRKEPEPAPVTVNVVDARLNPNHPLAIKNRELLQEIRAERAIRRALEHTINQLQRDASHD